MDGLFKFVLQLALLLALLLFLKIFLPPVLNRIGSWRVHFALKAALPGPYYSVLSNICLNTGRGEIHLDHVVVSNYGVFILEACHLWGGISGAKGLKWWTRRWFGSRLAFRNPLQLAAANIELLQDLLGLERHQFHSLAVFTCCAPFKPGLPVNVTRLGGMLPFIQVRTERLIEYEEVERIEQILQSRRASSRKLSADPAGSIRSRYQRVSGPVGAVTGMVLMAGLLYLGSTVLERLADTSGTAEVVVLDSGANPGPFVDNAPAPEIALPAVANQQPVLKPRAAVAEAEQPDSLPH